MASTPNWIGTWKRFGCRTTGASTVPDASTTTNIVKLVDAPGANIQLRVQRVHTQHVPATLVTNTAGVLRYYVKEGGTTFRCVHQENIAAVVPSATVKSAEVEWIRTDGDPVVILGPTDELWVASHVADPYDWEAEGGIP